MNALDGILSLIHKSLLTVILPSENKIHFKNYNRMHITLTVHSKTGVNEKKKKNRASELQKTN